MSIILGAFFWVRLRPMSCSIAKITSIQSVAASNDSTTITWFKKSGWFRLPQAAVW